MWHNVHTLYNTAVNKQTKAVVLNSFAWVNCFIQSIRLELADRLNPGGRANLLFGFTAGWGLVNRGDLWNGGQENPKHWSMALSAPGPVLLALWEDYILYLMSQLTSLPPPQLDLVVTASLAVFIPYILYPSSPCMYLRCARCKIQPAIFSGPLSYKVIVPFLTGLWTPKSKKYDTITHVNWICLS